MSAEEIAGALVNPKGMTKKMTASRSPGGAIAGAAGALAVGPAPPAAPHTTGVARRPRTSAGVGYLGVHRRPSSPSSGPRPAPSR